MTDNVDYKGIDELRADIAALTDAVQKQKANGSDALIDVPDLAQTLEKMHTRLHKLESADVVRKGEDIEPVTTPDAPTPAHLKGVAPFDLLLAKQALEFAALHQMVDKNTNKPARPPSKALRAAVQKAMDSTTAGAGDEYVPRDLSATLWDDIFASTNVANTIVQQSMTSDPMDIPLSLGDITFRKGTQNTAGETTDPTTADSTLQTTEMVASVAWSYTLDEDSIVGMMAEIRRALARNAAFTIDRFILNADKTATATGNINLDDSTPPADSYYLADGQDGIRHQWLVDNTDMGTDAGGDALTEGDINGEFAEMGKYYQDAQEDLVIVPDYKTYINGLLGLTNVRTLDKFGPEATILTGQLAAYNGVPIVPSSFHPLGQADGKASATASNNTLGSLSIYNRLMWRLGFRRQVLIEMDRDIQKRQFIMVASFRIAVGARERTSATHTGGVYNILV
jgi:hypothetical protein